ncbi:NAD(P)-dependent oxidoreductase [Solimonas marina]|uniref:NAD(P)-dependent oxidoreductase n=1 Tax=Solimonas marina TaxID=2714601 RepID=A0A970B8I1_9GAMM|nr:NAD(P)-dependent oxidoreductase [Solimonas marina]NKF24770.1 NAD(P)-dependent oxidoreductase [Solimonas marina]
MSDQSMALKVGVIGLGMMGEPMARLLAGAGFKLTLADADQGKAARLATEIGAAIVEADAMWSSLDFLITMLPTSAVVEQVLFTDGLAGKLSQGALVVDMSSSEPMRTRDVAARLQEMGLSFIDAPVSGGVKRATEGTLAIMVGGAAANLERARPVLETLGKSIFHVGAAGAGHAAKALNNYVSASHLVATVEALHAAEKFGIAPEAMTDVLNASSGRSNTSETKAKQFMLSGTYASGFSLKLMAKDLRIAMNLAHEMQTSTQIGDAVLALWEAQAADATATTDHTEMYRLLP